MNISKEEFRSYVNGSLAEARRSEVETYLSDHPLEQKALKGALEYQETDSFEALLNEVDESLGRAISQSEATATSENSSQTDGRIIRLLPRWILSAAAVVVLIFAVRTQMTTVEPQIEDYFDTYPDVITNIVRGQNTIDDNQKLIKAMEYYNSGDLTKAGALLAPIHAADEKEAKVKFYLAITEMARGAYEESLKKFQSLTEPGAGFQYDDGARWYQALCLVHLKRLEEATPILQEISQSSHYKKEAALSLLEEL